MEGMATRNSIRIRSEFTGKTTNRYMPLTPTRFNDVCDFAAALVFFAFDNDFDSTTSACPFSANSIALRFLAAATDIFAPLFFFTPEIANRAKKACASINGDRIDSIYNSFH